jgi:hypothetical protein
MNDVPRDITYCNFKECKRNCERNIYKHDFKGQGLYSLARFDTAEGFEEDSCEYYYPMENNYESSKM